MDILHIHQDFPDGRDYPFTRAVSNLIDASESTSGDFKHFVLSINRTSNPIRISLKAFAKGLTLIYWALPLSLIYLPTLWLYSKYLHWKLKDKHFNIIHAHSATTEGLLARYLSRSMGIPYLLTARGGSDLHNINRLPLERKAFRKNFLEAHHVFWVCKWFQPMAEEILKIDLTEKSSGLANICNIENTKFNENSSRSRKFFTVISFHQYKRKGIIGLIEAISQLSKDDIHIELDIFGTGPVDCINAVNDAVLKFEVANLVKLKGHRANKELLQNMETYRGLLLPSAKETLGMAYVEALATGNVILYHEKTGFHGFFESHPIGVAVKNQTTSEIKERLMELESNYNTYFENVKTIQRENGLKIFQFSYVSQHYMEIINTLKKG